MNKKQQLTLNNKIINNKIQEVDDFKHKQNAGGLIHDVGENINMIRSDIDCIFIVESINLIKHFIFEEEKNDIRFLLKEHLTEYEDRVYKVLEKQKYKNSNLDKLKKEEDKIRYFKKKGVINKKKFEEGNTKIVFGKDMNSPIKIDFRYCYKKCYELMMEINKKMKYYSILVIDNSNDEICGIYQLPIFKNQKIVGFVIVNIYENDIENPQNYYEEINEKKINNPYQIIEDIYKINAEGNQQMEKYHFGLYEPNVFRRKIIKKMNNIGIRYTDDENNILKSDKDKLNYILEKKKYQKYSK